MARWKIRWSANAREEKLSIMEFWYKKNGNTKYSRNLDNDFRKVSSLLKHQNKLGKKLSGSTIRYIIKDNFSIYYEIKEEYIEILHVWDYRQDPNRLPFINE